MSSGGYPVICWQAGCLPLLPTIALTNALSSTTAAPATKGETISGGIYFVQPTTERYVRNVITCWLFGHNKDKLLFLAALAALYLTLYTYNHGELAYNRREPAYNRREPTYNRREPTYNCGEPLTATL